MIDALQPTFEKAPRFSESRLSNRRNFKELIRFSAASNGLIDLAASLSTLFDSLEILLANPSDPALHRSVMGSALDIAMQLNAASARLAEARKEINLSIQRETDRANRILEQVAELNGQMLIQPAARLTAALKEQIHALSEIAKITAEFQCNETVNISLAGVLMVSSKCRKNRLAVVHDKSGNSYLRAGKSASRLQLAGGGIARRIAARDGGLADLQKGLDKLSAQLIARANSVYKTGCQTKDALFRGKDAAGISVKPVHPAKPRRGGKSPPGNDRMKWPHQAYEDFFLLHSRLERLSPMR